MFDKFVSIWRSDNSAEEVMGAPVDLVVPVCYAMSRKDKLAEATKLNFEIALRLLRGFPDATLAFGNWPYAFPDSEYVESHLKREMISPNFLGRILEVILRNSVGEAENIRDAGLRIGFSPKCILLVTGVLHSRSARFIWQRVFPNARIIIVCIDYKYEVEKGHIIKVQRYLHKWVVVALGRHALLRTFGLSIRNLRHRVVKQ